MTVCSNLLLESYCLLPIASCNSYASFVLINLLHTHNKCSSHEPLINVRKMTSVLIKEYIDKQSTILSFFFFMFRCAWNVL